MNNSGFQTIDFVIAGFTWYFVSLGFFFPEIKRGAKIKHYFLAGNKLTWWAVALH